MRSGDREMAVLPSSFYRREAAVVARELLGRWLVREIEGERLALRLVETEAYLGAPDRASHAWGGRRTPRNASLYLAGGHAYVYFIYGMHFCLNAVTGDEGVGSAVLLRAGEPVAGIDTMRRLRRLDRVGRSRSLSSAKPASSAGLEKVQPPPELPLASSLRPGEVAGGPGKLCQALAIDRALDGVPLDRSPLLIAEGEPVAAAHIVAGSRVGVDYAGEAAAWPLRFAVRGNPHVSRPRPAG